MRTRKEGREVNGEEGGWMMMGWLKRWGREEERRQMIDLSFFRVWQNVPPPPLPFCFFHTLYCKMSIIAIAKSLLRLLLTLTGRERDGERGGPLSLLPFPSSHFPVCAD